MGFSLNDAAYIITVETLWIFNFYIRNLCSHIYTKSPQAKNEEMMGEHYARLADSPEPPLWKTGYWTY